jgi:hypothetical protein
VFRHADVKKCADDAHKYDEGATIAEGIEFKDGNLKLSWVNEQIL